MSNPGRTDGEPAVVLHTLAEPERLVTTMPDAHVRYPRGFTDDAESGSIDAGSGTGD